MIPGQPRGSRLISRMLYGLVRLVISGALAWPPYLAALGDGHDWDCSEVRIPDCGVCTCGRANA
jgi:hypothetical protein